MSLYGRKRLAPSGSSVKCEPTCLSGTYFFFSSRRRHTRCSRDWSSDVCSSDLFYHGRRSDQAVRRIFGKSGSQTDRESSNLGGHGFQNDPRDRFANERFHAGRNLDATVFGQPCQFPKRDGCDGNSCPLPSLADGLTGAPGQLLRLTRHPDEDVSVEKYHFDSQSSSGVTGPTMSPTIFAFPAI